MKKLLIFLAAAILLIPGSLLVRAGITEAAQSYFNASQLSTTTTPGFVFQSNGPNAPGSFVATSSLGISGGSGSQTPFTSNVNAAGFNLSNVNTLTTGNILATSSSATSTIANDNTVLVVPTDFATNGCAGNPATTDFGACVNSLYLQISHSGQYSGQILVPNIKVTQAQWTTPINFNGPAIVSFDGVSGSQIAYGGTGTSTTFNMSNPTGHLVSNDYGITYMGNSTLIAAGQSNSKTTVGIGLGGSNGAVGVDFHDNNVNGFGIDVQIGQNAYMAKIENNSISGGNGNLFGNLLYVDKANNSGEALTLAGDNWTDPGNSIATKAVYLSNGCCASTFINGGSIDDVQIYIGTSDGTTDIGPLHVENSDGGAYGPYIPFQGTSSDRSTMINLHSIQIANDFSGTDSFGTIIQHGGQLMVNGVLIDNYAGGTVNTFSDHSLDNGVESEIICQVQVQGGSLTNIIGGGGNLPYSLATGSSCPQDNANSYPIGMNANQNNVNDVYSGSTNVETFDHAGNFTFLNSITDTALATPAGAFLAVNSSGQIISTTSPTGGVTSVSNSNSTLTISPTTGAVVASLNLTNPNTWTGLQQFNGNASSTQFTSTGNTYLATAGGNVGIGTSTPSYELSVSSATTLGNTQGIQYVDTAFPSTSQVLIGAQNEGTYSEPAIWMGSYASIPTTSNYIFNLDDNGAGAVLNAPGSNNLSLRLNNVTKAMISGSTGFFGIATSTPGSLLSVGGIANFTTATSSFYSTGGINLTGGGCYAINGTCISGGGSGTVGAGTTGQFPYYAANGTALTATSTLFIAPSGNIGISSSSPTSLLTINNPNGVTPFTIWSSSGTPILKVNAGGGLAVGVSASVAAANDALDVIQANGSDQNNVFQNFSSGFGEYIIAHAASNFVDDEIVGTASDWKFGEFGNTSFAVNDTTDGKTPFLITQNAPTNSLIIAASGAVGIGTSTPTNPLSLSAGSAAVPSISFGDTGTGFYRNAQNIIGISVAGANLATFSGSNGLTIGSVTTSNLNDQAGPNSGQLVLPNAGGLIINHNLADTNSALTIAQKNSGSTGPILSLTNNLATTTVFTQAGFEGIGTSTPTANFVSIAASSTVATTPYTGMVSIIGEVVNGVTNLFDEIDQYGGEYTHGDAPTLGSCGTSGAVSSGSNQKSGRVTVGTGVGTTCVVNFAHPYAAGATVHVFVNQESGGLVASGAQSISNTGFTITYATASGGDIFDYHVIASW